MFITQGRAILYKVPSTSEMRFFKITLSCFRDCFHRVDFKCHKMPRRQEITPGILLKMERIGCCAEMGDVE
jgi:hypothetical protein